MSPWGGRQAHGSGLEALVGCSLGVITASRFGSITLWPEAELRQAAEASGFVLPSGEEALRHLARLHSGEYPGSSNVSLHPPSLQT